MNGFEWTDGGAVKYTNWAPEEPGIADNDKQRCGEIGEIGLWSVSTCSRNHPYICQVTKLYELVNYNCFRILGQWRTASVPQKLSENLVGKLWTVHLM